MICKSAHEHVHSLEVVHHDAQGTPSSTMVWDGDSNRVSFTSSEGTGTWEYVYDTTAGIPAVIEEVTPSGSVYYIREPNGALIARVVGTVLDATTTRYYHFDALGSMVMPTSGTGTVTDTYSYDAWGNTTHTGSTEQPYQHVGQLGYYSHYQDENLDLLQLGVRFYDPQTGRFTQRDPIASLGVSRYAYTYSNPFAYTDGSGELPTIHCNDKTKAEKMETAITRICEAVNSGKLDQCVSCFGSKHLQCMKDFCKQGSLICGSRQCNENKRACGYCKGTPGEQHPEHGIVVCDRGFTPKRDHGNTNSPVTETILHEMMHLCGVAGDSKGEKSAEDAAVRCAKEMLK